MRYAVVFEKAPHNWVAYVRAGNPLQSAADAFVASPEFMDLYGALNDSDCRSLETPPYAVLRCTGVRPRPLIRDSIARPTMKGSV